jgi:hypothetical protein
MIDVTKAPRWQPRSVTARRYHRNPKTIRRWQDDPRVGFPQPTRIRGLIYDDAAALDAWDLARKTAVSS